MSKLNYLINSDLINGDLYPLIGESVEMKRGEKTIWYGKVLIDRITGRFTGPCETEEEADKEAQKLLERLRTK
jgi:hypothetical protein